MGTISESLSGRRVPLEAEHVVGRALTCTLRLSPRYVSAQHAVFRWNGHGWDVRDLGSRNGTFVDGIRLLAGAERNLQKGARVGFGGLDDAWDLVDDSPPVVMAVPIDGGEALVMEGDLLGVPSADDPHSTIYRGAGGGWVLEALDGASRPLSGLEVFSCGGRSFRFCCGDTLRRTTRMDGSSVLLQLRSLELTFGVSLDEEHVTVQGRCSGHTIELGARAHNYLLLTLARRRIADENLGLPETSCGWVDREDLANDPRMGGPQVNLDVFRIRRQFADKGVVDAGSIIERRPRELRIGASQLTITRL